ncbi:MAG: anti-sigma factor [Acidobacteriaceae bacterium]|nr:anti-sigma factor [Acidobacteriaceae bacterium]MBV9779769.1 anti-sigma factor [Acidobacteriaceae bacterium]
MSHPEMDELYELYVLNALDRDDAFQIDAHLEDDCAHCQEGIRAALQTTAALSVLADPAEPTKDLRRRTLSSIKPPARSRPWLVAIAGLSAACAALVVFSLWSATRMQQMRDQVSVLRGERNELRSAIELLTRSDTRTVQFGQTEETPHGRVLISSTGGVVFVGMQLPALDRDKRFELWLIPAKGAPEPAGMFRPNTSGESVHISSVPAERSTMAVAVTIEPWAGSPAPTTKPFLVVPLG